MYNYSLHSYTHAKSEGYREGQRERVLLSLPPAIVQTKSKIHFKFRFSGVFSSSGFQGQGLFKARVFSTFPVQRSACQLSQSPSMRRRNVEN